MSMMSCCLCTNLVDTDEMPDSLYVRGYADKCVCPSCFDQRQLETDFEEVQAYV